VACVKLLVSVVLLLLELSVGVTWRFNCMILVKFIHTPRLTRFEVKQFRMYSILTRQAVYTYV